MAMGMRGAVMQTILRRMRRSVRQATSARSTAACIRRGQVMAALLPATVVCPACWSAAHDDPAR
jgi:hypothetical protein